MRTPPARGTHPDVDGAPLVTMASRLELRRRRDVPAFLVAALRLQRRFRAADGGVRLELDARPLERTFFTLSTWRDEAAIAAYTADPLHREVMRGFRPRMTRSAFVTWCEPTGAVPGWDAALARLADAG